MDVSWEDEHYADKMNACGDGMLQMNAIECVSWIKSYDRNTCFVKTAIFNSFSFLKKTKIVNVPPIAKNGGIYETSGKC